jgi:hypothetical protein
MSDLVEFLRARLDEDEEVAQATRKNEQFVCGTGRWFASHNNAITSMAPHRAVAEVEAKRRLLEQFRLRGDSVRAVVQPTVGGVWDDLLRLLALPYADHPDYREEWRP